MNTENFILLSDIIITSSIASIIITIVIQKFKLILNLNKKLNKILSSIISFLFGIYFSCLFTDYSLRYDIFTGIITFSGAEIIYNKLKESTFSSKFVRGGDENVTKEI